MQAYEKDIFIWAIEQAKLLREGRYDLLDIPHLAEEIEGVGKEHKNALQSLYRQILIRLLKLSYSSSQDHRDGLIEEIFELRAQVESRLEDALSINCHSDEIFSSAWPQARRAAASALGKYPEMPDDCPYSLSEVLDVTFFPAAGINYKK